MSASEATGSPQAPIAVVDLQTGTDTQTPDGVEASSAAAPASRVSLPAGAGKISGMGESFSAELSTGIGSYSVPIGLPAGRGGVQASLSLAYSSARGYGNAGLGWNLGVPYIARQTDRGVPAYQDPPAGGAWIPQQDRFVFGGGQELVPIGLVSGGTCSGAPGETMPSWANRWQYFRPRVEGDFQRFFWSPDHRTWRVQSKAGLVTELGASLDTGDTSSLETDPTGTHIYRWNVVRTFDANVDGSGNPVNVVQYRYCVPDGTGVPPCEPGSGAVYLTDVYDTPPAGAATAPLSSYAHHARVHYQVRPDVRVSYTRGWMVRQDQRVWHVDVTSKQFASGGTFELVRRYWLTYGEPGIALHPSLLYSVAMEGRCASAVAESASGDLPQATNCPTLPSITLHYQHVTPYAIGGGAGAADIPGFEGFDERLLTMTNSPKESLQAGHTELFDVNADGLPDVLVTDVANYGGKHHAYLNGGAGVANAFVAANPVAVTGGAEPGVDANVLGFHNPNVSVQDIDGDGLVDLVHMPMVEQYAVYTLQGSGLSWSWVGRPVTTAPQQSPKIDFQSNATEIRVMDVNGDGLLDVVYSSGDEYDTFFSLGRYAGGDGQFGQATWTGPSSANLSNAPVRACVPWSATPVHFSDPDVQVADMNGDGLPDIVRVRPGDVRYWPGRGNGTWGTGTCVAGTTTSYAENQHVAMSESPPYTDAGAQVRVVDVNGDGFPDLVVIHPGTTEIWLNVDGQGWTTAHHTITGTPLLSAIGSSVQFADMNGSGTTDILWGNGGNYQYMDVQGGQQPWMLVEVGTGLGKTTDITYASSTQMMLAAAAAGAPWASTAPMPVQVVSSMTIKDNLNQVGRALGQYVTQYTYRDPVYEGRQREFRGFRKASTTVQGDTDGPTSTTEQTYLLGECVDETPNDPVNACSLSQRWRDNPRESLKGLVVVSEVHDGGTSLVGPTSGATYVSTSHTTWRMKQLFTGLDGRVVRLAYGSQSDAYRYEINPFVASSGSVPIDDVECEWDPTHATPCTTLGSLPVRSGTYAHLQSQVVSVDPYGNTLESADLGCVGGASCSTADEVLTSYAAYSLPPGDASGWSWRKTDSYVQGSLHSGHYGESSSTYDPLGRRLTASTAALSGTLPLVRSHATGAAVAPLPPTAARNGDVATVTTAYDAYGNVTQTTGPLGRCAMAYFDASFSQFPVTSVANACGAQPLQSNAQYDRGLGVAIYTIDPNGEPSSTVLDGFGRVAQVFGPHPTTPGALAPVPRALVSFWLGAPVSSVTVQTQNGADGTVAQYATAWSFVDGLGRTLAAFSQADPSAGDGGNWVVAPSPDYNTKGAVMTAYLPLFFTGSPAAYPLGQKPTTGASRAYYDAFGRTVRTVAPNGDPTQAVYHPMSTDAWDAEDLNPAGPHAGTYATKTVDGHGRSVKTTERIRVSGGTLETHDTTTQLSPTGKPEIVTRSTSSGAAPVVRTLQYDSWDRMVLNADPSATWRYAYDDAGDLVGTQDARGCGKNLFYDTAGREIAEDFSPCLASHAPYTAPDLSTGDGTEVYNLYDIEDPDAAAAGLTPVAGMYLGRLASSSDRGAKVIPSYDLLGRLVQGAKRVAPPGPASATLANRYAVHWWRTSATYDAADRPVAATTGAEEVAGTDGTGTVTTSYSARGVPTTMAGSYGSLVVGRVLDADGSPLKLAYGDAAATTTTMQYDAKRRLQNVLTYRASAPLWSNPPASYTPAPGTNPGTTQLTLANDTYAYDGADNPLAISDLRNPAEWLPGAMPVTRAMQYDDLYRLTGVTYSYPGGGDTWIDPFSFEDNGGTAPRLAQPSPHVAFTHRVAAQYYSYDWLGNTTSSLDDSNGFYDRSLGGIVNGGGGASPYQLTSASNLASGSPTSGQLGAAYDAAGNLVSMAVQRSGPCLPTAASCTQRFVYDWDEVGTMARARRWDGDTSLASAPVPTATPAADLSFTYGAGGRVLKVATDASGNVRSTVYVFPTLELRHAQYFATSNDYDRSTNTESVELGVGRVTYEPSAPSINGNLFHVLLRVADHLGSSGVLVDRDTGELAEARTYLAYGETESDYRPSRFDGVRDDYGFTGKEEDVELGIQYFGARYLVPALGRWASADPVSVHDLKADLNSYAYVHGSVYAATDPNGLDPWYRYLGTSQLTDGQSNAIGGNQFWSDTGFVDQSTGKNWGAGYYVAFSGSQVMAPPGQPPPAPGGGGDDQTAPPDDGAPPKQGGPAAPVDPIAAELAVANRDVGYTGDPSAVSRGFLDSFGGGPGYNYAFVWKVGSMSKGDTPQGKMWQMKSDPNAIFPFRVVPIDPDTGHDADHPVPATYEDLGEPVPSKAGEIHVGNAYSLQGAQLSAFGYGRVKQPGSDPVKVVLADDTTFMFETLPGHFDPPPSRIRFSTFARGDDVLFMQRGYAPDVSKPFGVLATMMTSLGSWATQARNLAGYPNAPTNAPAIDPHFE